MKGNPRPTTEESNYGQEQFERGYQRGYLRALLDIRKRRLTKEKCQQARFGEYVDFLEDEMSANRKH
jgi:hypothetical protein